MRSRRIDSRNASEPTAGACPNLLPAEATDVDAFHERGHQAMRRQDGAQPREVRQRQDLKLEGGSEQAYRQEDANAMITIPITVSDAERGSG